MRTIHGVPYARTGLGYDLTPWPALRGCLTRCLERPCRVDMMPGQ